MPFLSAKPHAALLTIADVGRACGLPHAVIMQLVPRTWTKNGWMYTREQREAAIHLAEELRTQQ